MRRLWVCQQKKWRSMKASVWCITYNHEKFISKALDGMLLQKTSFDFEIVVGDDASKDSTVQIIEKYQERFPGRIRCIKNAQNIGVSANVIQTLNACTGEYIALCEGDDYWTDENKLQKQIDFLEANRGFSMVFHRCEIVDKDGVYMRSTNEDVGKSIFTTVDVIQQIGFIMTCSIVFRRQALMLPVWFSKFFAGDLMIQLHCSLNGSIYFLNESMGCYRKHPAGISDRVNGIKIEKGTKQLCDILDLFDSDTQLAFHEVIVGRKKMLNHSMVEDFAYAILKSNYWKGEYWKLYYRICKYSDFSNPLHVKYIVRYLLPF
jgi:glycosyltransferase involved in cell wall biosynthesis